jgi:ribosomal protein S18 acetylase RimI-like enzyme
MEVFGGPRLDTVADMVTIAPYEAANATGVSRLCHDLGWPAYSDPTVAARGCIAPGVHTVVATEADEVIGFAQAFTDGEAASYLSQVAVAEPHRRRGIGRLLVEEVFRRTDAARMDLVTDEAADFYRSFPHKEWTGFRIYPNNA